MVSNFHVMDGLYPHFRTVALLLCENYVYTSEIIYP